MKSEYSDTGVGPSENLKKAVALFLVAHHGVQSQFMTIAWIMINDHMTNIAANGDLNEDDME